MTTSTLSLGPLVLVGTQRGLLVDVTINTDLCESAGEATISAPEWQSLVALVDVLAAADRRHAEDRAEIERLTTENANLREFIAASEECAKADDVLWYADENERMRAEFTRMMRQLETNGEVQFNASGCEWCGAAWPKPEGDTAEQVHERARRHVYRCAKHPMKIERDALTEQVASLRSTVAALKQECERMRRDYLTVADAVAAESTGPEDLAAKAKATRSEVARLRVVVEAAQKGTALAIADWLEQTIDDWPRNLDGRSTMREAIEQIRESWPAITEHWYLRIQGES